MSRFNLVALPHHLLERPRPEPRTGPAEAPVVFGAEKLARLWAELLDVKQVGIDDDFFALGGDSMLALEALAKVEKLCGKKLPLTALTEAATPRQFAQFLGSARPAPVWHSMVPIQRGTSMPPLFCVHPIGGDIMGYYGLASHLGREQPVYALRARGLDGIQAPHRTVEEMARAYIQEVRQVQPQGPYFLCGYSFGGLVAFEMARQFHTRGHKTALLAVFDSLKPIAPPSALKVFGHLLGNLKLTTLAHKAWNQASWITWRLGLKAAFAFYRLTRRAIPQDLAYVRASDCCAVAAGRYTLQQYPGKVTVIRAVPLTASPTHRPPINWEEHAAGGVETREVRSEHQALLNEPYVQDLAAKLTNCLKKAR